MYVPLHNDASSKLTLAYITFHQLLKYSLKRGPLNMFSGPLKLGDVGEIGHQRLLF